MAISPPPAGITLCRIIVAACAAQLEPGNAYYAFAGGYVSRDGYTRNFFNNDSVDDVNELFGRLELRFTPTPDWDLRFTVNGERDADGDFPLYDLGSLRRADHLIDHNYEGEAHRNVGQLAFNAIFHGQDVDFTSVTASSISSRRN